MRKALLFAFCAALLAATGCSGNGAGTGGAAGGAVKDMTDSSFAADTAGGVALVEFWAPW